MHRFVKPSHSPEQKNLGVEGIEDIIDVENEMGFGEEEEWSPEEARSYTKLASLKQGPLKSPGYIRSQSSSPPRRPAKNSTKWHPQKPSHGLKHGVSSARHNARNINLTQPVQPEGDHAVLSSHKDNDDITEEIVPDIRRHVGGGEDDTEQILQQQPLRHDRGSDMDAECGDVSLNFKKHGVENEQRDPSSLVSEQGSEKRDCSPQTSKQGGVDKKNNLNRSDVVHRSNQGNVQGVDSKLRMEKRQERNPNRVRFSLDFETAEKLMGHTGATKGKDTNDGEMGGANEEDHDIRQMEDHDKWQNVKAAPVDSSPGKGLIVNGRAVGAQKRREPVIKRDMVFDLEKAIEMRDDKKALRLAQDRIDRLEDALLRQQEIAAKMRISLAQDGLKDYGKLRQLLDALEKNIRKLAVSRSQHFSERYQLKNRADQVERLKAHCNMLEAEKERLKKKFENLVESTKEKEREVEALMAERDRLLKNKDTSSPENSSEIWEFKLKKVEESFAAERVIWDNNLIACQSDWKNEKQKWAATLKEKEVELSSFKMSQERLIESLILCQQSLDELKDLLGAQKGEMRDQKRCIRAEGLEDCTQDLLQSASLRPLCSPCRNEDIDALEVACSIHTNIQSLKKLLEKSPLPMPDELQISSNAFREEISILENKVWRTLDLTDRFKQEMETKEDEIRKSNESYGRFVAEKVLQVDALEKQLAEKEQSVDALVKGLKDEVALLSKELHQERSERSRLSDMQGDTKPEPSRGLQERELKWGEEFRELKGKLDDMTAAVALKDGRIDSLEEEVQVKADQLASEKQKWDVAIKEVKHRAAKTILRFVSDKENGLLEQLRERRKGRKTTECQTCLTFKIDDDKQGFPIYQGASSPSDTSHSYKQERSMERQSPRGLQASYGIDSENPSDHEELESHKSKTKQDRTPRKAKDNLSSAQVCCIEEEFYPKAFKRAGKNRGMNKQEIWDILERKKGSDDTTFTLLQSTVKDLE